MADRNGRTELDLTELLPQVVTVKAGDKTYQMSTDLSPAVASRVARWFASYQKALSDGNEFDETELWAIIADKLGCSEEEAAALGFVACVKIMAFLTRPLGDLVRTTRLSAPPSGLPSPMAEP